MQVNAVGAGTKKPVPVWVGSPEVALLIVTDQALRGLLHRINTRMRHTRDLTDQQWKILDLLVPEPSRQRDGSCTCGDLATWSNDVSSNSSRRPFAPRHCRWTEERTPSGWRRQFTRTSGRA